MSVAVYVTNDSDIPSIVGWALEFARCEHTPLRIILPSKSKSKSRFDELGLPDEQSGSRHKAVFEELDRQDKEEIVLKLKIAAGAEDSDHHRTVVSVHELQAPDPEAAMVQALDEGDTRLLVLSQFTPIRNRQAEDRQAAEKLFDTVHCQVVSVGGQCPPGLKASVGTDNDSPVTKRLLLVCENDQDDDDDFALKKTTQLAQSMNAEVTLLYVRPADDVVARQVADRHLKRLAKGFRATSIDPKKIVALSDRFVDGINQLELGGFDLIVAGTRAKKTIRQLVDHLDREADGQQIALAIVKVGLPLADQLWEKLKWSVRHLVPQIDRDHRVKLVDRLNSSSKFNFDFIALVSLSTLIAALGLARDSGAVVIGAMLVAPLMTPIVAIGLALVQGNPRLLKDGVKSVLFGFAVAILIGVVVGICIVIVAPNFAISSQMQARDTPNMLDLVVALASGVAAAYAMGRPHLISALPGVAIAAALVPPIATAGLSFAMGNVLLAGGASLLFFTNVVAIVLGTAITFWAVGISTFIDAGPEQAKSRLWPRYWFLGFVLVSCLLAACFSGIDNEKATGDERNGSSNVEALINNGDR